MCVGKTAPAWTQKQQKHPDHTNYPPGHLSSCELKFYCGEQQVEDRKFIGINSVKSLLKMRTREILLRKIVITTRRLIKYRIATEKREKHENGNMYIYYFSKERSIHKI